MSIQPFDYSRYSQATQPSNATAPTIKQNRTVRQAYGDQMALLLNTQFVEQQQERQALMQKHKMLLLESQQRLKRQEEEQMRRKEMEEAQKKAALEQRSKLRHDTYTRHLKQNPTSVRNQQLLEQQRSFQREIRAQSARSNSVSRDLAMGGIDRWNGLPQGIPNQGFSLNQPSHRLWMNNDNNEDNNHPQNQPTGNQKKQKFAQHQSINPFVQPIDNGLLDSLNLENSNIWFQAPGQNKAQQHQNECLPQARKDQEWNQHINEIQTSKQQNNIENGEQLTRFHSRSAQQQRGIPQQETSMDRYCHVQHQGQENDGQLSQKEQLRRLNILEKEIQEEAAMLHKKAYKTIHSVAIKYNIDMTAKKSRALCPDSQQMTSAKDKSNNQINSEEDLLQSILNLENQLQKLKQASIQGRNAFRIQSAIPSTAKINLPDRSIIPIRAITQQNDNRNRTRIVLDPLHHTVVDPEVSQNAIHEQKSVSSNKLKPIQRQFPIEANPSPHANTGQKWNRPQSRISNLQRLEPNDELPPQNTRLQDIAHEQVTLGDGHRGTILCDLDDESEYLEPPRPLVPRPSTNTRQVDENSPKGHSSWRVNDSSFNREVQVLFADNQNRRVGERPNSTMPQRQQQDDSMVRPSSKYRARDYTISQIDQPQE